MKNFLKSWGVKLRVSSAHYPQSNGRAECAVKAAKALVMGNTTPTGSINTDKYLRATLSYRNSAIYPETGKTVAQSLLGRNLRDCLPAVKGFYNLKKEHLMERKQRELVAAKRVQVMLDTYNKGAKQLPPLDAGDKVRVQNQTTIRTTKWDRTGVITATLGNRKYEIMMDGSRRITTRNRRHLRKIPGKEIVQEKEDHGGEEEDDDDEDDEPEVELPSVPSPPSSPAVPSP